MRRGWVLALLVACKQRGQISVPLVEPCTSSAAQRIGVYLVRNLGCMTLRCGFAFDCAEPTCIAMCATRGYCSPDEVKQLTIEPTSPGDYALVLTYQYQPGDGGVSLDQGLACFPVHLDADGTHSEELPIPSDASPNEGVSSCCMAGS